MKCQKCGKNEVNFHYASNVNGSITETNLCSVCASESGYDIGQMFDAMFPIRGVSGFMPVAMPMMQTHALLPFLMQPGMRPDMTPVHGQVDSCTCGCTKSAPFDMDVEVDEKMIKRRELNMQMRAAVEKEDFETAAKLRDKIKELET